jgi:hypothetical protein
MWFIQTNLSSVVALKSVAELERNSWAGQAKKKRKNIGLKHIISLDVSHWSNSSVSIGYNSRRCLHKYNISIEQKKRHHSSHLFFF